MCGLAGIVGPGPKAAVIAMAAAVAHRGPDDHGVIGAERAGPVVALDAGEVDGRFDVVMAHRRLAVIDPGAGGHQPMIAPDGRRCLAYNGELYNHRELRAELIGAGWRFRSRSDTEVLLAALCTWGVGALPRLAGMYAFAFLDLDAGRVLLGRDHLGIKPLYWCRRGADVAFASEQKALLRLDGVDRTLDPQRCERYLAQGQTDHGDGTMLRSIRQVAAGCWLSLPLGGGCGVGGRHWDPPARAAAVDAPRLSATLERAVESHLVADVPVGTALSGGLDSSTITALAARRRSGLRAIGYRGSHGATDEWPWMRLAATASGCELRTVGIQPDELAADLDDLIAAQDEPFGGLSIYAQYAVFRAAAAEGLTVMLDGQGADELFGGYALYPRVAVAQRVWAQRFGPALRSAWGHGRGPGAAALILAAGLRRCIDLGPSDRALPTWLRAPRAVRRPQRDLGAELTDATLRSNLPMLLRYEDRNSMRWGIESRVPFCDRRLVELALALPSAALVDGRGWTKAALRRAVRGVVPERIRARRDKVAFEAPDLVHLPGVEAWVDQVLTASDPTGLIDVVTLGARWCQARAARRADPALWRGLNFLRWIQLHDLG